MAATDRCERLASPNIGNFIVSCLILLGLLLSYFPQHYRIIRRRTTEGLSPWWILLGTTSGTCAVGNILLLPISRTDMACCSVNDAFSCFAGLLGIAQIGVQWGCFFFILFLYLLFTERHPLDAMPPFTQSPLSASPHLKTAVIITTISVAHFILQLLVSILILSRFPGYLQSWANILGIAAAILASVQYLPQIWLTWNLGHVGSLSIPMMLIQTPGGFVFAGSLAARLGVAGWSAWSVYLVLGTLQGVLLVICICFALRDQRREREDAEASRNIHDDEEGPGNADGFVSGDGGDRVGGEAAGIDERSQLLGNNHDAKRSEYLRRHSSMQQMLDPARLGGEDSSPESVGHLESRRRQQ